MVTVLGFRQVPIITVWDTIALLRTHFISRPSRKAIFQKQVDYLLKMLERLGQKIIQITPTEEHRPRVINLIILTRGKKIVKYMFCVSIRCGAELTKAMMWSNGEDAPKASVQPMKTLQCSKIALTESESEKLKHSQGNCV